MNSRNEVIHGVTLDGTALRGQVITRKLTTVVAHAVTTAGVAEIRLVGVARCTVGGTLLEL